MTPRYSAPVEKLPDPPAHGDHADDDPPPEKNWVRLDFPPGSTPEEIARVLMEWKATHSDDAREPDA